MIHLNQIVSFSMLGISKNWQFGFLMANCDEKKIKKVAILVPNLYFLFIYVYC